MEFKKGDRVICIDDNLDFPEWVIKGKIRNGSLYTVRSVCEISKGIRVEGVYQIINPDDFPFPDYEKTLKERRFRKVWDDKALKEFNVKNKEKEPVKV